MLEAIVFDLDGVLIDSEPLMRFAFAESYRQILGPGSPPIEAFLEHMGDSFPHIMQHLGLPQTMWEPYRALCQQHIDRIRLFPQSAEVLTWAHTLKLKLAILTGKDRARALQILEHFRIRHFFQEVVASDQLDHPKPDPEGLQRILRTLQCLPAEAIMIGDAVSDIVCAERACVPSIAVTWGIKPERVQRLCHPTYIAHDWQALWSILQGRLGGTDAHKVAPLSSIAR